MTQRGNKVMKTSLTESPKIYQGFASGLAKLRDGNLLQDNPKQHNANATKDTLNSFHFAVRILCFATDRHFFFK